MATVYKTSNLVSGDETITVAHQVVVLGDGSAIALHPDSGDVRYSSLYALCNAYEIEADVVRACESYNAEDAHYAVGFEDVEDNGDFAPSGSLRDDGLTEWRGTGKIKATGQAVQIRYLFADDEDREDPADMAWDADHFAGVSLLD